MLTRRRRLRRSGGDSNIQLLRTPLVSKEMRLSDGLNSAMPLAIYHRTI
jgi:hypothetical protein